MATIPEPDAPDLRTGTGPLPQPFGRYILIERIGAGGMAEIFRAMTVGSEGFRRVLVVKRIRRELCESADFLRMFCDEAKISALLNHPNIVQVFDFGQIEGAYFLAMEHVEGRDLATVMKKLRAADQAITPSLAGYIALQVAQALAYAHTLESADGHQFRIVHRDINPSNVMLVRSGAVKVLDFGIAKASAAAGKSETRHTLIKGKLSYLSPEQARCEPLDGRSDVFSLGATLWEMLTGKRLFHGKADFERVQNVLQAPVPAPSERRPGVPAALDYIALKALSRDLSRRYQSAEEMAKDLEDHLREAPPEPRAIRKLLTYLFGQDLTASNVVDLPALDGAAMTVKTVVNGGPSRETDHGALLRSATMPASAVGLTGSIITGSPPPVVGAVAVAERPPLRSAMMWGAGAAALVVLAAALFSTLSRNVGGGAGDTTVSMGMPLAGSDPSGRFGSTGAGASASVRIEVESDPAGATVHDGTALLGTTPLAVTLPSSAEARRLRLEKTGYEPAFYEVKPQSSGLVFVELQPKR
jgi:serine/threonine protein kinase